MHSNVAAMFNDWDEALIWSCLQGHMGNIILDNEKNPASAMIEIGDFCFFAGQPSTVLFHDLEGEKLLIPKDETWEALIEHYFELRMIDGEVYELARKEAWSVDLCSQFKDYADYQHRAFGVSILHNGELVAGASPYAVYNNGIEIEIDTRPDYRGKGLATVCGAKLILECLARNVYPSWDAHDLRSVALAEKLGYHLSHPYVTYELIGR